MKSFTKIYSETYTPLWTVEVFSVYNRDWIHIRNSHKYKADRCFKCGNKFQIGDTISLACFSEVGNKVLCRQCAKEMNENDVANSGGQGQAVSM